MDEGHGGGLGAPGAPGPEIGGRATVVGRDDYGGLLADAATGEPLRDPRGRVLRTPEQARAACAEQADRERARRARRIRQARRHDPSLPPVGPLPPPRFAHEAAGDPAAELVARGNRLTLEIAEACAPELAEIVDEHLTRVALRTGMAVAEVRRYAMVGMMLARLPRTAALARERGHLTLGVLHAIAAVTCTAREECLPVIDELLAEYLTPGVDRQPVPAARTVRAMVRRLVERTTVHDAPAPPRPAEALHCFDDDSDGMRVLGVVLRPERGYEAERIIDAAAAKEGCSRTEALMRLLRGRAEVRVTVNLYRGVDAGAWDPERGWLTRIATRSWLDRADHLRTVVDSRSTARLATAAQRALVMGRDGGCRFPGCDMPAAACEIDHVRPWPEGPTDTANLQCLCPRHHHLKTMKLWNPEITDLGAVVWSAHDGDTAVTLPRGPLAGMGRITWGRRLSRLAETRRRANRADLAARMPGHEAAARREHAVRGHGPPAAPDPPPPGPDEVLPF